MSTELIPWEPETPITPSIQFWSSRAPDLARAWLEGRNPQTLRAYTADFEAFRTWMATWAQDSDRSGLWQICPELIAIERLLGRGHGEANRLALAYRAHMIGSKLSAATVNRRLASLRSLVALANTLGMVPWKLDVKNVRAEAYRDTRGPGRAGLRKLLGGLPGGVKGIRDRAILRLLYDLALRRGEVVQLDVADVDLARGTLAVLGKGRSARELLTLPAKTTDALREWLAARPVAEGGPLFVGLDRTGKHGRLGGASIYRLVRYLGDKVGVKARPHGIRHHAITEALDQFRGDVRSVQKFSRHRKLETLLVYDDRRADVAGEVARRVSEAA